MELGGGGEDESFVCPATLHSSVRCLPLSPALALAPAQAPALDPSPTPALAYTLFLDQEDFTR